MPDYGELFAAIYNQRWGGFPRRVAPLIRAYYENQPLGDVNRTLLDVACGTGQLIRHFLEYGYTATGLDLSEHMLSLAQANCADFVEQGYAEFVCDDASNFLLDKSYGLAVSTYDALNHLPDGMSLTGCFRSVYAALAPGGVFIFDLNTRHGLLRWNGLEVTDTDDLFMMVRGIYDGKSQHAYMRITGFVQQNGQTYARFSEVIANTVFDMQTVSDLLRDTGFVQVCAASHDALDTALEDPETVGRVFFVAHK